MLSFFNVDRGFALGGVFHLKGNLITLSQLFKTDIFQAVAVEEQILIAVLLGDKAVLPVSQFFDSSLHVKMLDIKTDLVNIKTGNSTIFSGC